jgi:hypothetical protein
MAPLLVSSYLLRHCLLSMLLFCLSCAKLKVLAPPATCIISWEMVHSRAVTVHCCAAVAACVWGAILLRLLLPIFV